MNKHTPVPDTMEALERARDLILIARKYFPRSIKNSDRFTLENTNACICAAIRSERGE
jgi:hypothetical protein